MFSKKFKCVICDKDFESFYTSKYYRRIKKTCSKECHKKLMSKITNQKIEKECVYCKNIFKIKRSRGKSNSMRGKYCSKKCFYTHRKITTKYVTTTCSKCNKTFEVNEKRLIYYRKKYGENCFKYCSRHCALTSNDKTSIEKIVENILIKNNIKYLFNDFKLDNFSYDFYILNTNILIECDGHYWHNMDYNNEKIFELNTKSKCNKDLRKTISAIKNNYILLRFKEHDILNNTEYVELCILEAIKSKIYIDTI